MSCVSLGARLLERGLPAMNRGRALGVRTRPERMVLGVADGVTPSSRPPVRIFLGTQPAQYRAERVFIWSIEQTRDPSRVYEIYIMKELAGFHRRWWLTGFTNYRFAVPHFAGGTGRAIWNDVDQAYLADPAELFDTDMDGHGFLLVPPLSALVREDSSVMLIDCRRMASVWTLEAAQRMRKETLLAKARAVPGLRGYLAPEWNARDQEYVPGRSKLLHWTILHTQPWRPAPRRFIYQHNPVGYVWFNLERSADIAGYQEFSFARPSAVYTDLIDHLHTAQSHPGGGRAPASPNLPEQTEGLRNLIGQLGARTILEYRLGGSGADGAPQGSSSPYTGRTVTRYDPTFPSFANRPSERFDGVVCVEGLQYVSDADVPWVIEALFGHARRFLYVAIADCGQRIVFPGGARLQNRPRSSSWWYAPFEAAGARHPAVHWKLVLRTRTPTWRHVTHLRAGGRWLGDPPRVWVLVDARAASTSQAVALAEGLRWPYETKVVQFSARSRLSNHLLGASRIGLTHASAAALAPPWPDLVLAAGRRTAPVARWIGKESRGHTRLVQVGCKGCEMAERSDVVVTPAYCRQSSHPRRIETVAPLTRVTAERLAQAGAHWPGLFGHAPHPRIVLLVGGPCSRQRLSPATTRHMAEAVRAFAQAAGGSVSAVTGRSTGPEVTGALVVGLGDASHLHWWKPGEDDDGRYLAYLAGADAIVVSGEDASTLVLAAASGKPVYVFPPPARSPGLRERLQEWVFARAHAYRLNKRGTVRPQRGLEYACAHLIAHGIVRPRRDLNTLHQTLFGLGVARPFGAALETRERPALRETDEVAVKVRTLLRLAATVGKEDSGSPQG